jgi:hypothetical protein
MIKVSCSQIYIDVHDSGQYKSDFRVVFFCFLFPIGASRHTSTFIHKNACCSSAAYLALPVDAPKPFDLKVANYKKLILTQHSGLKHKPPANFGETLMCILVLRR